MSAVTQIAAVVGMNLRAMPSRLAASSVVVVGMAAVVAAALSIFSMSTGLTEMVRLASPTPDRMAILSQGALEGGSSNISREALDTITAAPGIKKGPDGKPLVSGGAMCTSYITRKKENGVDAFVGVCGYAPNILYRRPNVKLIAGRLYTPGLHELIAGQGAVARFENIALGKQIPLADGPWTIVGVFQGAGTSDYDMWGDLDTLMASLHRTSVPVAFATLQEGTKAAQEAFAAVLKSNPALSVDVETEQQWRLRGWRDTTRFYRFLAYGVGAIMGLGTIFATLNTMYTAVSARVMEIATLRAIGFSAAPVIVSIAVEALGLALLGGAAGALVAWGVFNGHQQNFGSVAVSQVVTPMMIIAGMAISIAVGAIGAVFPAIRAARLPVATALQGR